LRIVKPHVLKTPLNGVSAYSLDIVLLAGMVALGVALTNTPASAQGIFDFLFGSLRRPGLPAGTSSYGDPNVQDIRPDAGPRSESGSSVAYCVRLCDGRFFPIQRSGGANPALVCGSVCPAARTKTFSGGTINHAVAPDGTRYADLQNAFAFRDRIVANCTCNGKDSVGLVTASADDDPTLRPGDIVATNDGFVAYNGGRQQSTKFTPIGSYGGLSAELRQHLAAARITPSEATPRPEPAPSTGERRVQLSR
jgi:hypothetical protein